MRVVGLDLSLTGSGVAQLALDTEGWQATIAEYGTKPNGTDIRARSLRLRTIAGPVIRDCQDADLVAVEDLYMGAGTGGQLDRAGLFWIVVNSLVSRNIPVALVTNNHLKMFALGRGGGAKTDKAHVMAAVIKRYPTIDITSDNIADSVVLAAMAARHLGFPIETELPATHLRALAAVAWPQTRKEQHA